MAEEQKATGETEQEAEQADLEVAEEQAEEVKGGPTRYGRQPENPQGKV